MAEKWDHDPSKNSSDDIDRLIAQKPDATVGDAVYGISAEEFSLQQLEDFKKERDSLVMEVIMMQKDIDNLEKALETMPRYHPDRLSMETRLEELESSRVIESGKINKLETLLAKHRPLRN
jgi:hypothetical protein